MTSDERAFLDAIIANPDEDAPRLVFADWLQENGDPDRAEFIRVQCELARLREAERDVPESFRHDRSEYGNGYRFVYCRHFEPERVELLRAQARLLTGEKQTKWAAGLPKFARAPDRVCGFFSRGFVGHVCAELFALLKDPAVLWAHHPIESLVLSPGRGRTVPAKVIRCAAFARVRELSLSYTGEPWEALAALAQCPHLTGLRALDLTADRLSNADAAALTGSAYLRPAHFRFRGNDLTRKAFAALVQSPFASRLRAFLPESAPGGAAEAIADAPLGGLRWLFLSSASCGDAGVAALTRSQYLTNLVTLDLSGCRLTDAAAEALAAWPGLASVRFLNLSDADITAAGVEALIRSPNFRPLLLDLSYTAVGDIGAAALAGWPGLGHMHVLNLNEAQVCDTGGFALARSPHAGNLRYLKLPPTTLRRSTNVLYERFGDALDTAY